MTLYERIRQLRISKKMSQTDLALKMGYKDGSMITKIESGKVDISQKKIVDFAKALDTTPAYLMGWTEESEIMHQERLSKDEHRLVTIYRSLSAEGKKQVLYQAHVAQLAFGEKSSPVPASGSDAV